MKENLKAVAINENSWYFSNAVGRAFLFKGSNSALLVDTTNGPGDLYGLIRELVGNMPVVLINTHADSDHIGCNNQFRNTFMNPSEFAYYATKSKKGDAIPLPIEEGDLIDIGGRTFEIIETPGHTYGSISILNRKERFLIGGDTILTKVFIFGPQRNLRALIYSLKKIRDKYLGSFDMIYTSHFEMPLSSDFILEELSSAEALLDKRLVGTDPGSIPLEPPEYKPALLYKKGNSGFFAYADLQNSNYIF